MNIRMCKTRKNIAFVSLCLALFSCKETAVLELSTRYDYDNILEIAYTPNQETACKGWFADQGSWMGFTIPSNEQWVNGFCGPFCLDNRIWMSDAAVVVGLPDEKFQKDSTSYFPGELYIAASSVNGQITQRMIFMDKNSVLLHCQSSQKQALHYSSEILKAGGSLVVDQNVCILTYPDGRIMSITFPEATEVNATATGYEAVSGGKGEDYIVISYFQNLNELTAGFQKASNTLDAPEKVIIAHNNRWEGYLKKTLRDDLPETYNRVAVKSIVTLISNWRSKKGGLLHDGIVPSHAVGYFVGFWAWDSWKHAVGIAPFEPELAKNQIRAMFDYQTPNGMIIDCIYSDITENNARDSKPPLAAWAVNEVYKATQDTAFLQEMYPQLLRYHRWWYKERDHNKNGICEFGSIDGTAEAAAWESGMDNAIRFDDAKMVQNGADAWSFDQESVDLNAYLAFEYHLLKDMAKILEYPFSDPNRIDNIAEYFFNNEQGYYFDRRLKDQSFVLEEGSEGYIPLWTGIASKEQAKKVLSLMSDSARFATYIPCPTVAANNPKFMPKGYWRGPIWLDQTYFGISGLRNYGYDTLADTYTHQVFDRLQGLQSGEAIHENYGTHTGERLKAPHFSWSAAHLLMLYRELSN